VQLGQADGQGQAAYAAGDALQPEPAPVSADAYRLELVTRNIAAQVKAPLLIRDRRHDMTVEDARRLLSIIEGGGWKRSSSWRSRPACAAASCSPCGGRTWT
jgi:hypothetical protein